MSTFLILSMPLNFCPLAMCCSALSSTHLPLHAGIGACFLCTQHAQLCPAVLGACVTNACAAGVGAGSAQRRQHRTGWRGSPSGSSCAQWTRTSPRRSARSDRPFAMPIEGVFNIQARSKSRPGVGCRPACTQHGWKFGPSELITGLNVWIGGQENGRCTGERKGYCRGEGMLR